MTRTTSAALLAALLAAGLAGCHAASSATPAASAPANRQQLLALGQRWVTCMRDHGLTRMPDAQLSQDGYLSFDPQGGYDWKHDAVNHPAAIAACKSIEDSYPPNAFRPKDQTSPDDLRKLGEYAACVRAHGLPAFPDPNANGVFDLSGTPLANGIPAKARDAADQACHGIWSGSVKIKTDGTGGQK